MLTLVRIDEGSVRLVMKVRESDLAAIDLKRLIRASAPHWSKKEISRLEESILSYHPQIPAHYEQPDQRKFFANEVRATKKDLLQAIGLERIAPENRKLVATEQRALGNRFDQGMSDIEGGFIGSPMEASAMTKAKDRDILNIFSEIPDDTEWDHPKHFMRGGNIQLSRAFAEFARTDPERATRLIEQFEPLQQERAAGYALDAMADNDSNDDKVIESFLDLHARKFQSKEYRNSASHAIEKIAKRKTCISDEIIDILVDWLRLTSAQVEEEAEGQDVEILSTSKDEEYTGRSILWGGGFSSALPSGNFSILSALASALLNNKERGRDRYITILNDHLLRERDPNVWKALLISLSNAGGSSPQVVSTFLRKLFDRFPEILATFEAVYFLAYAQRWDTQLVFDLISNWPESSQAFSQQAYGELVGLATLSGANKKWTSVRDEIIASGTEYMKIGLAHAAVNMWPQQKLRATAGEVLVALLKGASKDLVAVAMGVFRVTSDLSSDAPTVELLRALADPDTDMSAAPSHFVVEGLQALLPHEAELIATIAEKLVNAWRGDHGKMRPGMGNDALQLTDLALTLHRLGGPSRRSGVALFEAMIEIDAYGARETLAEIDGRFGQQQAAARRRLARRRKRRRPPQ